jgi:lysyl endopeptidase
MKTITSFLMLLFVAFSFAQQGDGGTPISSKFAFEPEIPIVQFAQPNVDALLAEDALVDGKGTAPWRFGFVNESNLNINNSGAWFNLPNGGKLWMLQLHCENALTVNITLQNSRIPEGNELFVYHPNRQFVLGRFTERHLFEGALGCELINGSQTVVEYYVAPENISAPGYIEIASVTHGYRTAEDFDRAFGGSGSCNMNVNCPDGQAYQSQRDGVVMLVSGSSGFCTGSLINNTANDGKPYVLTARHCGDSGFANWIFRFNWQAAACSNPSSSPSFQSLSGSVNRAGSTNQTFDMRLVEITGGLENGTVPASYNPFFAGWDNSGVVPTSTFCIHHPSGDIKKIAFDDQPAVIDQGMGSTVPQSTWRVVWDRNTTTEPGSSGSPLYDQNGRIIGQLWGGGASCTNLSSPDWYGRVSMSWNPPGSTNAQQLKHWLDPGNTGVTFIDGFPQPELLALDGGIATGQNWSLSGIICGTSVTPVLNFTNYGSETITAMVITYSYGSGNQNFNWTGSLATGASTNITLPSQTLSNGNYTFTANISTVNSMADENNTNNQVTSTFTIVTDGIDVQLKLQLDCWGDEVSWRLLNQYETQVLLTGGTYAGQNEQLVTENWCLAEACYVLEINDSWGDGIGGGFGCATVGSLQIVEGDNVLNEIPQSQANFGSQRKLPFCVGNATTDLEHLAQQVFEALLYPNPTDGTLNLAFNMIGQKNITVYTTQGALVFTGAINGNEASLNLEFLSTGIYFVEIRFGDHVEIHKIVKQ